MEIHILILIFQQYWTINLKIIFGFIVAASNHGHKKNIKINNIKLIKHYTRIYKKFI